MHVLSSKCAHKVVCVCVCVSLKFIRDGRTAVIVSIMQTHLDACRVDTTLLTSLNKLFRLQLFLFVKVVVQPAVH